MKVLNRFRKRNIQTNISHFLLVIFVVAVSVCLITGLFISHLTLKNAVEKFYNNSNLPNLWIETDLVRSEDEDFFQSYDYGKRYIFDTEFMIAENSHETKVVVSDGSISTPYLIEGDKGSGCYVDAKFIEKYKIGINYSMIFIEYTHAGQTQKLGFKVLGSMSMAEDLLVDEDCVIFIDEQVFVDALNTAFQTEEKFTLNDIAYNQILITSELSQDEIQIITNHYQISNSQLISLKNRQEIESFKAVKEELQISELMLWMFPLLFILVAILVAVSTIIDLVSKERYNIGLLKSLGIKNNHILSNYCGYGVFMCLLGSFIGVIISPLIVPNMTFEVYDVIFNLPRDEVKMIFPFSLGILTIFAAGIIGYFSSYFVCLNLVLKTPKDCMYGQKKIKTDTRKKLKNRFGKLGSAIKNMKINTARTMMSIVGVAGCSILSIIGFGLSLNDKMVKTNKYLSLEGFFNIFQAFSIVMLMLTILILGVQIFKERAREVAMLRINGDSFVKIWFSLILELFVVVIFGFVVACILSYPTMLLTLYLFGISSGVFISFWGFLKSLLCILIISIIVSGFMFIKVYKINLVDAIKFSE